MDLETLILIICWVGHTHRRNHQLSPVSNQRRIVIKCTALDSHCMSGKLPLKGKSIVETITQRSPKHCFGKKLRDVNIFKDFNGFKDLSFIITK